MRLFSCVFLLLFMNKVCAESLDFVNKYFEGVPEKDLSLVADIINTSKVENVLEHKMTSARYVPSERLFVIKLTHDVLHFSSLTVHEAKAFGKDKLFALHATCNGPLYSLLYRDRVTFRYIFKDKEGVMTTLVDINALTCEALRR